MADGTRHSTKAGPISSFWRNPVSRNWNKLRDFKAKTQQEAIYLEIQRDVDVRFV